MELPESTKDNIRSRIASTLQSTSLTDCNLTKDKLHTLKRLKNDKDIVILPADKGLVTVVMDKKDYTDKMDSLVNPLRPRNPIPDYPHSIQRKWLPKMKIHTCHSNLQFTVTSPSLFTLELSIHVAHVSNYSPDIFNLQQSNTVSRKKILFTAITVIFQQVYV